MKGIYNENGELLCIKAEFSNGGGWLMIPLKDIQLAAAVPKEIGLMEIISTKGGFKVKGTMNELEGILNGSANVRSGRSSGSVSGDGGGSPQTH